MKTNEINDLNQVYHRLAYDHGLTFIPLNKDAKHPVFQRWQQGTGYSKFNWPDNFQADRRYAVCPHLAGLAVIDIDTAPPYIDKKQFRADNDSHAALELIHEHVQALYGAVPDLVDKVVAHYPSGSGKGYHIWFRRNLDDEWPRHGRPSAPPGEIFDGSGYVVLYEPALLLAGLDAAESFEPDQELTGADIADVLFFWNAATQQQRLARVDDEADALHEMAAERRRCNYVTDTMTVPDLVAALGNGPAKDFTLDFQRLAAGPIYYERITHPDSPYYWTPATLAATFSDIPAHYWDDYWFWLWAGMALHDAGCGSDLALQLWSEMSRTSISFDPKHQVRTWMQFNRNSDSGTRRTMGTIVHILRELGIKPRIDFSSVEFFMAQRLDLTGDPADFITTADLYKAYELFTRADPVGRRPRKSFTAFVGAHGLTKNKRAAGRGFQGVKLI